FKAYTTRVGEGPFPTEEKGEMGEELRRRGKEYGATTGRPRRCGWLDLPLLRYAVEVSGASALALTKVDVLSGMERIKVCVSYRMKGKIVSVPASLKNLENVEPVYEEIRGWKSLNTREFDRFLDFIEREVGCKIKYISTGPGVDEIVEIGG
ncbi:MAG TPA: adenylosuccinate synthetase, partial [Thermotoga sp.]|nr:adenylosuccinate synthetase [Thermotoga sp.]